jgi:hypothetical protein
MLEGPDIIVNPSMPKSEIPDKLLVAALSPVGIVNCIVPSTPSATYNTYIFMSYVATISPISAVTSIFVSSYL